MVTRSPMMRFLVLLGCLILGAIALAGCGQDKFEGYWVGQGTTPYKDEILITCVVEKNGNGYLLTPATYHWFEGFRGIEGWSSVTYTLDWVPHKENQMAASAKNNSLIVSHDGFQDTFATYIEKNKTLQATLKGLFDQGPTIEMHRVKDEAEMNNAIDKFKNDGKEAFIQKQQQQGHTKIEIKE